MSVRTALAGETKGETAGRLGIAVMLLGMLLFSLNDAMGKWLVATFPVGQVILIRSAFALAVLLPFLWRAGPAQLLRLEQPGLQAARVAFSTAEVFCFYTAVTTLPLADVITYWMASPIYVAALSPLLLGERVGPWRWAAIVAGFAGVLFALGPTGTMAPAATAVAIVGSLSFALMILTARSLRHTPDKTLVFWQTLGALAAGLLLLPSGWTPPGPLDFGLLGLLGVVAMVAHVCVNRALKLADAATVAPLQYTLLLYAIIFGWLFFGDAPRPAVLLGAALIVAAGLFIFLREQRARRR